jgi:hypothetical protein
MPLKTYFQTFVLQSSEDQSSNVEDKEGQSSKRKGQTLYFDDKEDQRSNEDQILNVDDDDQNSNLYNEYQMLKRLSKNQNLTKNKDDQKLKRLSKDLSSTKNKDDQSLNNKCQTSIKITDDQTSNTKSQSKRKRPNSNLHNIEDQRSKRLFEGQSIPMDNLEIIDFVSSNTNEQLLTSLNCSSDKSPVAKSPITQLSSENDRTHDKWATLKTYNKNRKSNKPTFQKATDQNYTSDQMSQPNCLTVKQEIKKEREEEEDITIEDSSNPNTTTQIDQMSLTNCPNTSEEDITIEDPSSLSSDSNTTSQNDSLTNCPNDDEMTFEESPLFSSSIKVEESQIVEFPSFSDESQNDTSMETSGKFIDQ